MQKSSSSFLSSPPPLLLLISCINVLIVISLEKRLALSYPICMLLCTRMQSARHKNRHHHLSKPLKGHQTPKVGLEPRGSSPHLMPCTSGYTLRVRSNFIFYFQALPGGCRVFPGPLLVAIRLPINRCPYLYSPHLGHGFTVLANLSLTERTC